MDIMGYNQQTLGIRCVFLLAGALITSGWGFTGDLTNKDMGMKTTVLRGYSIHIFEHIWKVSM
jgi:hypothetical protein